MGIFGIKKIVCPKNQWTTIISNSFVQMPASWQITFKPKNDEPIVGTYLEKKTLWVFPQKAIEGKLEAKMVFNRAWLNTFYSLKVCPTDDVVAEID